jgi:hypothetical protein
MREPQAIKRPTKVTLSMSFGAVFVFVLKVYLSLLIMALITSVLIVLLLTLLGPIMANVFASL